MKNLKFITPSTLSLIHFLFAAALPPSATAQIVKLTGNLDPIYSVKISPTDLDALSQGLSGATNLPVINVDINSIYSENDVPAFETASQEVSRVLIEAAKNLVDMRALIYKLNIDLQQDSQKRFTQQIYVAYQGHFQKRFKSLLSLF